jgi:alcohol dehydrogenase class IV
MSYAVTMPGKTLIGERALEAAGGDIRRFGQKALVVTDPAVAKAGILARLTGLLGGWGVGYEAFDGISGEPTDKMIEAGVAAYRAGGCDFLIGIGGGSPMDSAKAIAAMTVLAGGLRDYMGVEISGGFPPAVLIPTTAGTGSEATKFTVVTDTRRDVKMLLKGDALLPALAVIDYTLTRTVPPPVTAATGMDALTHAVEAYTSRKANAFTDALALDAARRIFKALPVAYRDGGNAQARAELSYAAYEAGICINNASVTLVHGMSRPVGALFHVPHGLSNAMLVSACLQYALEGSYERFAAVSRAVGAADAGASDRAAAEAFLAALDDLCGKLQIPTLRQYGIDRQRFFQSVDKMAGDAMASGSPSNTIREIQKEDLLAIYGKLW